MSHSPPPDYKTAMPRRSFWLHKKCPRCRSRNVRHLSQRGAREHRWLRARYTCRSCNETFWLIRTTPYYIAASLAAALGIGALTWSITSLVSHVREERQLVSAADALESTAKRARAKDAAAEYELARRY